MAVICIILSVTVCVIVAIFFKVNAKSANEIRALTDENSRLKAEQISFEKEKTLLNQSFERQADELKSGYERQIEELKMNHSSQLERERETLGESFKALASEILNTNSQQLDARSRLSLEALLAPMRTRLEEFTKGFRECYDVENRDRLSLREEIKALHDLNIRVGAETAKLTNALKGNTRTQGHWGEMVLANILEHSGLQQGRWFVTQESTTADDGSRLRPDAVIHCPRQRDIIIDSKASLTAYLTMLDTDDPDARKELIDAHVRSVENHIATLRRKDYQEKIGAKKGDFVLMFMPHEGAYLAAMNAKPDLWEKAYDSSVIMVSPTHLVTVVRLVEQMWQAEDQSVNSLEIAETASKLLDSLNSFLADMASVGDILEKAQKAYESASRRLSTGNNNVVRVATRLESLGVKAKKTLPSRFADAGSEEIESEVAP